MKIDFNRKLKTMDGKTLPYMVDTGKRDEKNQPVLKEVPFTLKLASTNALNLLYQDEKIDGEEKAKRGSLAIQIYQSNGILDLSVEDIALIKMLIGKMGSPLVVYQAYEMLEEGVAKKK